MKPSQIAALPVLVGIWNFVNQTTDSMGNMAEISGTMFFKGNGYLKMTVPNKTALGDYILEDSWGYIGDNKLTECFAGGCENATLTTVSPHNIEFTDNHGDTIHLMRNG